MRRYLTKPYPILLSILALLFAGYQAAYPYLNPDHLQWQNAIIYGSMAIISAIVLGYGHIATQQRLARVEALSMRSDGPPTTRVPTVEMPMQRRQADDEHDR